jgi:hypothetical protein
VEIDIPEPNPALTQWLMSQRCRDIVMERAQTAQWLYQSRVAKRSTLLAKSAHGHTEIGGRRRDRWIGVLSVHAAIEYEASHEFGHRSRGKGPGRGKEGPRQPGHFIPGAHDLNAVLEELGST